MITSYVVYTVSRSVAKYFSYPIASLMKLEYPDSMPFPAITICPLTALRRSKIAVVDSDAKFTELGLNITACHDTAAVRGPRPCGEALMCCCMENNLYKPEDHLENCTKEYKNQLKDALKNGSQFNMREFYEKYSPDMEEMLIPGFCSLDLSVKGICSAKDFDTTMTDDGLCYTFNSGRNGRKILDATFGSLSAGLSLMLDLKTDDHAFGLLSEGLRVLVHNQGEYVNPMKGISVPPGRNAVINVHRLEV